MPTLNNNKRTATIHGDDILFDNNEDKHNDHVTFRTSGQIGENDIHFEKCNLKVKDGHLSLSNIKDLAGNDVITVGTNSINFHNATTSNLSIATGALSASSIASANGYDSMDLELDAHLALISGKVSQNGHTVNKVFISTNGGALTTSSACVSSDLAKIATNGAVDLNTAKTGITSQQASDITANNAKVGITTQQSSDITANNAKVGITSSEQTKLGHISITQAVDLDTMESNINTNNGKVSMVIGTAADQAMAGNT